jgi:hypothetical protein
VQVVGDEHDLFSGIPASRSLTIRELRRSSRVVGSSSAITSGPVINTAAIASNCFCLGGQQMRRVIGMLVAAPENEGVLSLCVAEFGPAGGVLTEMQSRPATNRALPSIRSCQAASGCGWAMVAAGLIDGAER